MSDIPGMPQAVDNLFKTVDNRVNLGRNGQNCRNVRF